MYLKISGFVTLVGHFFKKTTRHFVIGTRHIYDTEHIENNVLPLYSLLFSYLFVHNMPVSLKSSLTAHNLKTGGVSLLFFLLDNFSQLHTNLTPPPFFEGEQWVRSIYERGSLPTSGRTRGIGF